MGVDDLNEIERNLLAAYSHIFKPIHDQIFPDWAFSVAPPIPFVGARYSSAPKQVLVYASAENLNHKNQVSRLLDLPEPMLRSRWFLDDRRKTDQDSTFVHINPIDNRSLLLAARHILNKLCSNWAFANDKPSAFLDQIAVANPGKFSIDPAKINAPRKRNFDYANDPIKFEKMREYILADIEILKPTIIIIPKTIAATLRKLTCKMDLAQYGTVIEVYQVSPQAINCHIKKQVGGLEVNLSGLPYGHWNVSDRRLNMGLYLQWLDKLPTILDKC